eukprot:403338316
MSDIDSQASPPICFEGRLLYQNENRLIVRMAVLIHKLIIGSAKIVTIEWPQDFLNSYLNESQEEEESDQNNMQSNQDNQRSQQTLTQNQNGLQNGIEIIYQQYQPQNSTELREYLNFLICKSIKNFNKQGIKHNLGSGQIKNMSNRLLKFLTDSDNFKKKLLQKYNNDVLLFDSTFECGNLLQAEITNPNEYQLYMQVDTNTRGHQQWFYFKVKNTKPDRTYLFKIMNFTKPGLVKVNNQNQKQNFDVGSQPNSETITHQNTTANNQKDASAPIANTTSQYVGPSYLGQKKQEHLQRIHYRTKNQKEWQQIDSEKLEFIKTDVQRKRKDILAAAIDSDQEEMDGDQMDDYAQNFSSQKALNKKPAKKRKPQFYYALQFEFQFTKEDQTVYFSFALPNTLTDITHMILQKENEFQQIQLEENPPIQDEEKKNTSQGIRQSKKINTSSYQNFELKTNSIFYRREELCRSIVHAAETPGSFVFEGIFNFLTSNNSEAKYLRKFYTFILVPTLNPDGIVCGNYRSSIAGVDLNRQWILPDQDFHPEIFAIKSLMKTFHEVEKRKLWIYCDLHGHSKKKNSFFYGCNTAANGGFLSWTIVRLLPRIFAKKTHLFNFKDCRFKVEPYKLGTGRVVAWKQFQITHSFTLESSFYGYDYGEDQHKCFTETDYQEVGSKLCQSIFEMHFLWKSIRNELKLTNGWLKPRKLIEMTGTPAAQVLHEELQRKKKEDQKRRAIEQYEQFLKKYFNTQVPTTIDKRRLTRIIQVQNLDTIRDITQNNESNQQQQQAPIPQFHQRQSKLGIKQIIPHQTISGGDKSRNHLLYGTQSDSFSNQNQNFSSQQQVSNNDLNNEEDNFDYDSLYQKLLGLVKIQALIRGYLTRKKIIIPKVRVFRRPQKMNQNSTKNLLSPHINHDLRNQLLDGVQPVNEVLDNINWRQYFQQQELEEAFQKVEVEKIDDPEEQISDGSSSNPSIDNLDMSEIYEKIYNLKPTKVFIQAREEANMKFMEEINNQDYLDQQQMFRLIDDSMNPRKSQLSSSQNIKDDKNGFQKQSSSIKQTMKKKNAMENKQVMQMNVVGSLNQQNLNSTPDRNLNRKDSQSKNFNGNPANQRKSPYHPQFYSTGLNIDSQVLKKSNTQSPIPRDEVISYPLTTHSIFDNKPQQRQQTTVNQTRPGQTFYPQHLTNISTQQLKMFQAQQSQLGRRENISQVIKDCFITKKITNKNPQQSLNTGSDLSRNPQQNEGQRVHSFNHFKSLQQQNNSTLYNQQFNPNLSYQINTNHQGAYNTQSIRFVQSNNNTGKKPNKSQSNAQKFQGSKSPITHTTKSDQNEFLRDQASQFYMQHNNPTQGIQGQSQSENRNNTALLQNGHQFQSYINSDQDSVYQMMRQDLPPGIFNGKNNESASSLFMRYVKQKLVKKIKTDQMPLQIADKYIDIYKELVEKESQKRNQDMIFQRNQVGIKSQSMSYNLSRNKSQTKSEQKSRTKARTNKSNILSDENLNNQIDELQVLQNAMKSNPGLQLLTQQQYHAQIPIKDDYQMNIDNQVQSYQSVSQSYSKPNNFNDALSNNNQVHLHNHTFEPKTSTNMPQLHQQSVIIQRQHVDNDQIPSLVLNPIDDHHKIIEKGNKTRFPNISHNFSSTLEYKKKSRDIIKESKSIKNQQQQMYSQQLQNQVLNSFNPGYENQIRLQNNQNQQQQQQHQNSIIFNHIPGINLNQNLVSNIHQQQLQQKSQFHLQNLNENNSQNQHQISQHQYQQEYGLATSHRLQSNYAPNSQHSIESSTDEEMLDKIKNIYSEMRSTTKQNIQQYQKNYYQQSKNTRIGALRQQRLLLNPNQQQQITTNINGQVDKEQAKLISANNTQSQQYQNMQQQQQNSNQISQSNATYKSQQNPQHLTQNAQQLQLQLTPNKNQYFTQMNLNINSTSSGVVVPGDSKNIDNNGQQKHASTSQKRIQNTQIDENSDKQSQAMKSTQRRQLLQ